MGASIAQSLYGSETDCAVGTMEIVTISPKYQVVIPKSVRQELGLQPGQQVMVMAHKGQAHVVPVEEPEAVRGMSHGMDTTVERDMDREL